MADTQPDSVTQTVLQAIPCIGKFTIILVAWCLLFWAKQLGQQKSLYAEYLTCLSSCIGLVPSTSEAQSLKHEADYNGDRGTTVQPYQRMGVAACCHVQQHLQITIGCC